LAKSFLGKLAKEMIFANQSFRSLFASAAANSNNSSTKPPMPHSLHQSLTITTNHQPPTIKDKLQATSYQLLTINDQGPTTTECPP